ncbi:PREDICTED: putative nuclease HARBI1 [Cyphomyrmex costatus]|uniref:putative nuclease HARBI1 n=1 Tax=Cyphomyrmex costatus TaxID=456900 RepID=UPI0008523E16|nr:PREDICTED: putative nuclease HARBI1 [Cyphomyrmex costatus]
MGHKEYRLENDKKRKRKCWMRPIFRPERRRLQGASNNLVREMQLNDADKYFNYFRMSSETIQRLLALVGPHITKQECIREPIPPRTRLEITLRYLASGDSMSSISYAFRIGHNTVSKIIAETCKVIWTTLKEEVFLQPNATNWQTISEDFNKYWNFPHCIGAIDGKHIIIQAPANSGSCFYNYKGNHSINLLAVSDAKYRFIIVDIGAPGRQGDSGVLTNSGLMNLLENNKLKIPPAVQLDNSTKEFPFVFVADEAFPLTTFMMRPGLVDINRRNITRNIEAVKVRDSYASYFENVNPLSWQWDKVLANDF